MILSLVIVRDLDIVGIAVLEAETDAPLIVDGNGVLAFSVSLQGMKAIARWRFQVIQTGGQIDVFQTPDRPAQKVRRKPFGLACQEERLRVFVGKRFNHGRRLTCHVTLVKEGIAR
jgi:hypothetical protein